MPDAGHLLDLFNDWTPDAGYRASASSSTIRRGCTGSDAFFHWRMICSENR